MKCPYPLNMLTTKCKNQLFVSMNRALTYQCSPCDFWCVFFSPSGVKSMSSKSNFAKLVGLSINCLAIGATTASEIQQDKYRDMWKLQAIARKPSPGGVLRALQEYYKSLS